MQSYSLPLGFSAHNDLLQSARLFSDYFSSSSSTHWSSSGRLHGGRGGTFGVDNESPNDAPVIPTPNSAPFVAQASLKPQTFDYLNAELASAYGMSRSTAYQEALSNTAYQRAVKDMKSAGLNPAVLFGAGRGSPAQSSVYASYDLSSGKRGYGRSSSAKKQLFSSSAYSALSAIGGLAGIVLTGRPDGYWIGSQTLQGAMALLDTVSSSSNK